MGACEWLLSNRCWTLTEGNKTSPNLVCALQRRYPCQSQSRTSLQLHCSINSGIRSGKLWLVLTHHGRPSCPSREKTPTSLPMLPAAHMTSISANDCRGTEEHTHAIKHPVRTRTDVCTMPSDEPGHEGKVNAWRLHHLQTFALILMPSSHYTMKDLIFAWGFWSRGSEGKRRRWWTADAIQEARWFTADTSQISRRAKYVDHERRGRYEHLKTLIDVK